MAPKVELSKDDAGELFERLERDRGRSEGSFRRIRLVALPEGTDADAAVKMGEKRILADLFRMSYKAEPQNKDIAYHKRRADAAICEQVVQKMWPGNTWRCDPSRKSRSAFTVQNRVLMAVDGLIVAKEMEEYRQWLKDTFEDMLAVMGNVE